MGQTQSTQQGGRPREFSKTVDDLEFNVPDISKKIKTGDEFEDSSIITTEGIIIYYRFHLDAECIPPLLHKL